MHFPKQLIRERPNVLSLLTQDVWQIRPEVLQRGLLWFSSYGTAAFVEGRAFNHLHREHAIPLVEPVHGKPAHGGAAHGMPTPGSGHHADPGDFEPSLSPLDALYAEMGVGFTDQGQAVIPIDGVLMRRWSQIGLSEQGVSTEALTDLFEEMAGDDRVRAVTLRVDSPGGSALGTVEVNEALLALSGVKPVTAVASDVMASAAYFLASAAREIVVGPTSIVGSIGTVAVRVDESRALENEGVRVVLVANDRPKLDGNPAVPFDSEELKRTQEQVAQYQELFETAVSRRLEANSIPTPLSEINTGRVWVGEQAVGAGVADRMGTLRDTVRLTDKTLKPRFAMRLNPFAPKQSASKQDASKQDTPVMEVDAPDQALVTDGSVVPTDGSVVPGEGFIDDVGEVTPEQIAKIEEIEARYAEIQKAEAQMREQEASLREAEAQMREHEARQIQKERLAFVDTLVQEGRILAKDREGYVAMLEVLSGVENEALGIEDMEQWHRGVLAHREPVVPMMEVAPKESATLGLDMSSPEGAENSIRMVMDRYGVNSVTAVECIQSGTFPDLPANGKQASQ